MKSARLVTALTSLTTGMAVAAPLVIFGFLYVIYVQPARAAADESRSQLAAARDELNRRRSVIGSRSAGTQASALEEFDARTTEGARAAELADALTAALNSPAVGGVSNLSIESGAPADNPVNSMVHSFAQTVIQTRVTVTFDARYEQIRRFFRNLRALPTIFDLQSVELLPLSAAPDGLMRAKVLLLAFHRVETGQPSQVPQIRTVDVTTPPQLTRNPFAKPSRSGAGRTGSSQAQPDPVVGSILISRGRRVALVDGLVVGRGDRVRAGVVHSIEADAVVIVEPGGRTRRVEIARPLIRTEHR